MQTKHTPGPWCAWQSADGARGVGKAHTDEDDLFYVANPENRSDLENEANMQLAATAPELLSALEELADYVDEMHRIGHIQRPVQSSFARDAIAKATQPINAA